MWFISADWNSWIQYHIRKLFLRLSLQPGASTRNVFATTCADGILRLFDTRCGLTSGRWVDYLGFCTFCSYFTIKVISDLFFLEPVTWSLTFWTGWLLCLVFTYGSDSNSLGLFIRPQSARNPAEFFPVSYKVSYKCFTLGFTRLKRWSFKYTI